MGLCFSSLLKKQRNIPITSSSSSHDDSPSHSARHHAPPPPPMPPAPSSKTLSIASPTPPPPPPPPQGQILGKPYIDISTLYDLQKELGRGHFGITYLCTEKSTGLQYACKSISRNKLHLVMELCSGGELFDRITERGSYSEKEAARIGRQIVNVVHVCHFMGVMHRDLKPENFLMVNREEESPLKATDFGLSVFIEQGQQFLHENRRICSLFP